MAIEKVRPIDRILEIFYSFAAVPVLLGALFKITHTSPFGSPNGWLYIGLGTEALVFTTFGLLYIFRPPKAVDEMGLSIGDIVQSNSGTNANGSNNNSVNTGRRPVRNGSGAVGGGGYTGGNGTGGGGAVVLGGGSTGNTGGGGYTGGNGNTGGSGTVVLGGGSTGNTGSGGYTGGNGNTGGSGTVVLGGGSTGNTGGGGYTGGNGNTGGSGTVVLGGGSTGNTSGGGYTGGNVGGGNASGGGGAFVMGNGGNTGGNGNTGGGGYVGGGNMGGTGFVGDQTTPLGMLNDMLRNANITPESLNKLSLGFKTLEASIDQINTLRGSINDAEEYSKKMHEAITALTAINAFYHKIAETSQSMISSAEEAKRTQEQLGVLAQNLAKLNQVYGGMLIAMQMGTRPF